MTKRPAVTRRLARQLNLVNALGLPSWSTGPSGPFDSWGEQIAKAGYEGVQTFDAKSAAMFHAAGLTTSGIGRCDTTDQIDELLGKVEDWGGTAVSVHLGTGFEDDKEAAVLVEHLVERTASSSLLVVLETHRATLTQDPARTIQMANAYPELRFCADLSHWYTGVEMTYGDIDAKFDAMDDVLRRTRMVHGRIGDPGCIQVALREDDDREFIGHFMRMWRTCFDGYLADPDAPDEIAFLPELLPASVHYARTVDTPDGPQEDCDRWQQGLLMCDLAEDLFREALASASAPSA